NISRFTAFAEEWFILDLAPKRSSLTGPSNGIIRILFSVVYVTILLWMIVQLPSNDGANHSDAKTQRDALLTIAALAASVLVPGIFRFLVLSAGAIVAGLLPLLQVIETFSLIWVLLMIVPGSTVAGYTCSFDGKVLPYKLNGLAVLFVTVAFYYGLCTAGWKDPTYLAAHFFDAERPVDAGYQRCLTRDQVLAAPKNENGDIEDLPALLAKLPVNKNTIWALEYFNGSFFNPRVFGVDVKMALYCLGAVMLQLNILSMAALHTVNNGGVTANAVTVYVFIFTWFLIEYSYYENVHLYTYDLFAEKIGAKLVFGCLGFYPYLYCIGGIVLTIYTPNTNSAYGPTFLVFYTGWFLTRGANMQKFFYKTDPASTTVFFGKVEQKVIPGSRILYSGFWGVSRHVNYLGEIIQGVALALPGFLVLYSTEPFWLCLVPWIYPLYYVCLFIPRERDDNEICRKKYGKAWDEYCEKVPYRIVPYIY
ncbi:hypothetical protein BCR33DRAFT_716499, partial [Rhizoclosmatium globosum]